MVQEKTPGTRVPPGCGEVRLEPRPSHVLEHADARHLVEHRGRGEVTVVAHLDAAAVLKTVVRDAVTGERRLRLAQGDAENLHAVAARRVAGQPTPTTPDVQQRLSGTESQRAADEVELGFLRLAQILVSGREIGAGVGEMFVEPERVEIVADVVVVLDGAGVARRRVAQSAREPAPKLRGAGCRRGAVGASLIADVVVSWQLREQPREPQETAG